VRVRIPIPVAVILSLMLVGGIWWRKTAHYDFLTPPSEAKLAQIRHKMEESLAKPPQVEDAISIRGSGMAEPAPKPVEALPVEPPKPAIDPGNLAAPPALDSYADQAFKGPAYLIELASFLETEGHFLRAYSAWERILDSTKPDDEQAKIATNAIKRLRPSIAKWNDDPSRSATVIIQVGTGKKITKKLKPVLEQAAKDIEQASSGLLKVKTNIAVGKGQALEQGATPVAMWFSGGGKDAPATEVLSFTATDADNLELLITQTLYSILRSYFTRSTLNSPTAAMEGERFSETLEKRVTRLTWERLGSTLNPPLAPKP